MPLQTQNNFSVYIYIILSKASLALVCFYLFTIVVNCVINFSLQILLCILHYLLGLFLRCRNSWSKDENICKHFISCRHIMISQRLHQFAKQFFSLFYSKNIYLMKKIDKIPCSFRAL